jgi:hypothetical protein
VVTLSFVGCEKCGVADNRSEFQRTVSGGAFVWPCPDCGRPMAPVTIREAIELVQARAEAERWRARSRRSRAERAAPAGKAA